ncbi:MAG TPA: ACP S-malonyltransferase [Planctomycetota bacterium]|nr:ACP S-malonyltransferase [Planctomycetota bacterium]
MKRVGIVCAGRGSYTERSLGSLPSGHAWVERADALRAEYGLLALSHLDAAGRFSQATHLRPANVAPLIWLVTLLDAAEARREARCVAVAGNSMGWYSALAVAGALDFDDGFRLVQEMALLQEESAGGGQMIQPVVGEDWRPDPAARRAVDEALATSDGHAFPSIELGGYVVLAGDDEGLAHLARSLPRVQFGKNAYPFKLVQHGPYHTPLCEGVAARARERLGGLAWRAPEVPLVDGRGVRWTPWSCDTAALRDYTLGRQVVAPYDFTHSVRVLLREHGPDELVLPGPGNSLGGVCGQILVAERWRGVSSRAEFEALQAGPEPVVRSMRR